MNTPYIFKKCSKCGKWLIASKANFNKQKRGKYGLISVCKNCQKKYNKIYHEQNKEALAEYHKRYYDGNKDKINKYHNEWVNKNKEHINNYHKEWDKTPKGQVNRINSHNRRRINKQEQGNGITREQWLECMTFFGWKCAYSGEYLGGKSKQEVRSVDHVKPLNKGGEHEIWNIVPMYKTYNNGKRDRDLLDWYTKQDFFSEERLNKIKDWQEYAYNKWGK